MVFITLLLMLPFFLLGGILLLYGIAKPSRWWMLAGVLLMLPFTAEFVMRASIPDAEWNPLISSETEIVGTYADDDETLALLPDKTFTYHSASKHVSGTWERYGDFNLKLDTVDETLRNNPMKRFIEYKGRLYLAEEQEDLDMWDGDLGLPKIR